MEIFGTLVAVLYVTLVQATGSSPAELCSAQSTQLFQPDTFLQTPDFPRWYSIDECSCTVSVTSSLSSVIRVAIFVQTLDEHTPWCQPEVQVVFRGTITSVCPSLSSNASFEYELTAGEDIRVLLRNSAEVYMRAKIRVHAVNDAPAVVSCGGATVALGLYSEEEPGYAALGAEKGALAAGAVVLIIAVIILLSIIIKIRCSATAKTEDRDSQRTVEPPSTKEYIALSVSDGLVQPQGSDQTSLAIDKKDDWPENGDCQAEPWNPFDSTNETQADAVNGKKVKKSKKPKHDLYSIASSSKPRPTHEVSQPLLSVYQTSSGTPIMNSRCTTPDLYSLDRSRPGSARSMISHSSSVASYHGLQSRSNRPGSARYAPKHPINLNRVDYPLHEQPETPNRKTWQDAKNFEMDPSESNPDNILKAPIVNLEDEEFDISSDREDQDEL